MLQSPAAGGGPNISFVHAYPHALPAMRADQSALGSMPTSAFQYCEAMRTASGFGWYIFPAMSVELLFDGVDTYIAHGSEWERLTSEGLPEIESWWNPYCPEYLVDMAPPFISAIGVPGYIQIWSGLLVQTAKDWSALIRPLANVKNTSQFFCFEGIVETDHYAPAPLFINLRLQTTNAVIEIRADEPLFQVQPVHRASYDAQNLNAFTHRTLSDEMTDEDWAGYRRTIRTANPIEDDHSVGQYAVELRRRSKKRDKPKS